MGDDDSQPIDLAPLRPRRDSAMIAIWRTVPPRANESCRWESPDQRWISVRLGEDEHLGQVVVDSSWGSTEVLESYEEALERARSWQR